MDAHRNPDCLLSLSWVTTFDIPAVDHIEAAAEAGFNAVSVRVGGTAENRLPLCADPTQVIAVRRALQGTGLHLLHIGAVWLDGNLPVSAHERTIACGAELGTRLCVAVAPAGRTLPQVRDDFAALCELAAMYRTPVAFEPVSYMAVRTLDEGLAVVGDHGSHAGLLVDALHVARTGGTCANVAALPSERVFFAQLCDAPAQAPPPAEWPAEAMDRLDPGLGELPLDAFLRALPPGTPLEVEAPRLALRTLSPGERARRSAEATRALMARALPPPDR